MAANFIEQFYKHVSPDGIAGAEQGSPRNVQCVAGRLMEGIGTLDAMRGLVERFNERYRADGVFLRAEQMPGESDQEEHQAPIRWQIRYFNPDSPEGQMGWMTYVLDFWATCVEPKYIYLESGNELIWDNLVLLQRYAGDPDDQPLIIAPWLRRLASQDP